MYGAFQNCLIEKFQIVSCKHIQEGEYSEYKRVFMPFYSKPDYSIIL